MSNPQRRALMDKIAVVTNDEFTRAYERTPIQHRTRVTVTMADGNRHVGESGGDDHDPMASQADSLTFDKFRNVAEQYFSAREVNQLLDSLLNIEDSAGVSHVVSSLVLA